MTSPAQTTAPTKSAPAEHRTTSDTRGPREAIVAANGAFMTAFGRRDAAGIAACYSADAQLLPAQSDVVSGRPAIEAFWQQALGLGLTGVTLESVELYHVTGAPTATEVGRYALLAGADQVADRGKYVVIWAREADGQWRLHRDIWTTSQPAAPAA